MSAEAYPYNPTYAERGDCLYDESKATTAKISSYTYADSGDIDMMKMALSHQPIAAAMTASTYSFQLYEGGVYDDETCSAEDVDHTILLVGYGSEEGEDYWIVKNSWGTNWGMSGYMKVGIKPGAGICGIQTNAVWTVLES